MVSVGDIIRKRYVALGVAVGRPLRTSGELNLGPRITLSDRTIAEDADVSDIVGTLSVINGAGSYTFAIDSDPSAQFDIDGSNLIVADALAPGAYPVEISASGGDVAVSPRVITITVTEVVVPPDAPTANFALVANSQLIAALMGDL